MTVNTELAYAERAWTGVETSFAPGFPAAEEGDVKIVLRRPHGERVPLTMGTHYSITLAPGTGTITMTPIALPYTPAVLEFGRRTSALQQVDFQDNSRYGQEVHELIADKAMMLAAENRTDVSKVQVTLDTKAMLRNGIDLTGNDAWDARGARLISAAYPLGGDDVATRSYVDSVFSGAEIVNGLENDLTFIGQNTMAVTANLRRDSRAFYVPGGGGWFADYDCKSAQPHIVRQGESQLARGYGGYRDALFVHHADEDTANYTDLFQVISTGFRSVVTGKWTGGIAQKQYKDLIAGDFSVIGRIDWVNRGLSGVISNVIQLGRGIASNEFSVEQPAWAYEQSSSMAAVQAIVRQRFAAADVFHPARGIFISSEGYRISAGLEMVSIGGLGGLFEVALDMVGAWVDKYAIRMPQTGGGGELAHAGTLILYDGGDYTGFDRAADRYFWAVDDAIAMQLDKTIASIGPVAPLADAFLTLPPGSSSKVSLYLTPGIGPFSGPNGGLSTDGTDLFFMSAGNVKKCVLASI